MKTAGNARIDILTTLPRFRQVRAPSHPALPGALPTAQRLREAATIPRERAKTSARSNLYDLSGLLQAARTRHPSPDFEGGAGGGGSPSGTT